MPEAANRVEVDDRRVAPSVSSDASAAGGSSDATAPAASSARSCLSARSRLSAFWTLSGSACPRLTAWALFAVAALLRIVYVVSVSANPSVRYPMVDARAYHERALAILAGDWLGDRVAFQAPLYPYILAGTYRLFGVESQAVLYIQALLDAGTVVLVYLLARRAFGERCARVAGVVAAGYSVFFYYDALLLKPALSVFVITATLWAVLRADDRDRPGAWLVAGSLLGLATLLRGNFLLLVPWIAVWIGLATDRPPLRRALAGAALLVGVGLLILPMTLRNYIVSGDFVITTSQAGANFYLGNHRGNDTGRYSSPDFLTPLPVTEERLFEMEAERRAGRALTPSEQSRFWLREGWAEIAADPGHFVRHTGTKIALYLNHYEIPDNQSFDFFREHVSPLLRWPFPGWGAVAPFTLVGIAFVGRGRAAVLLLGYGLAYSATVLLFYVMSRYRMPVVPVAIIFAAHGGLVTFDALRARRWRRALPVLLALGLLFPWVHRDLAADDDSVIRANLGIHHLHRSEALRARAGARAAEGDPGAAAALFAEADHLELAAEENLRLGASIAPGNPVIRRRLAGLLLDRTERLLAAGQAEAALIQAVDLGHTLPGFPQARLLQGLAEQQLGRDAAARRSLQRALRQGSDDPRLREALRELDARAGDAQPGDPD